MELISKAFLYGGDIPAKYMCDGENISPPLVISDVPEKTDKLTVEKEMTGHVLDQAVLMGTYDRR